MLPVDGESGWCFVFLLLSFLSQTPTTTLPLATPYFHLCVLALFHFLL